MDVQSLNDGKSKIVSMTRGLPHVYAHLGEYLASRVLFTTDEPLAFTGYHNELTGLQMRDLGYKIANALTAKVVANPKIGWSFTERVQQVSGAAAIITDADTLLRSADDPDLHRLMASGVRF